MSNVATKAKKPNLSVKSVLNWILDHAMIIVIVLLALYVQTQRDAFLKPASLINIISLTAARLPMALGVAGCIILAGTDLTGGRVAGLTAFVAAILLQRADVANRVLAGGAPANIVLVLLLVMLIGACVGLINGFVMAKFKVHPYIITLAMQMIVYGIYLTVSNSVQVGSFDSSYTTSFVTKPLFQIQTGVRPNGTAIFTVVPMYVLLALIVGGVSLGISNYYYKGMLDGLERQARAQSGAFVDYFMDQGFANYLQRANQAISDYADKERVEMQFLSSEGSIQASSTTNLTVGTRPGTEDISRAVETNRISYFRGADPKTGEQILAVSHPLTVNGKVVGVLRFVTSLRQVNVQVRMTVLAVVLVALLCLLLVLSSNLIFINNVVEPVAVVSDAAKRISQGSYGFTLENKYTGELGELVDNINDMSMKIGQNEKMKTEFISSVSHELRTPLTAISGWGETLLADRERDQIQLHRGLRIILNESRRLSTMVEELLEFSKMEDGRFTLQLEEMDLQAEFEDAIFTYRELFRQEGIELRYEPGEEILPPISGDPERLKQVFCNVLDNAAKHGGAGRRIDVSLTREGTVQVVRVRDYGPGVPAAELPYVKQKFYKGSSKARGSGIGLAVCDEIVRLHGGTFDIANAEGGGAVVTICIPEKE